MEFHHGTTPQDSESQSLGRRQRHELNKIELIFFSHLKFYHAAMNKVQYLRLPFRPRNIDSLGSHRYQITSFVQHLVQEPLNLSELKIRGNRSITAFELRPGTIHELR